MGTVLLERGDFGTYLLVNDCGCDLLVQTDWDYPGVASHMGWDKREVPAPDGSPCDHDSTDGTVDCECGAKVMSFISAAREWLDDHIGDEFDDPGYFIEDECDSD